MKKLIATTCLGLLLVAGFFVTFDNSSESAIIKDIEPGIYSIENSAF